MIERFTYLRPATMAAALEMLEGNEGVALLAGGTDLVPAMRRSAVAGGCLLDLSGLGLDKIEVAPGEIRLGAMVTFSALLRDEAVREKLPVLVQAASQVGAVQTRSLATIGGNLCSGLPSQDSAPPLMVLGAALRLVSGQGERVVAVEDFFLGPRRTLRRSDEILAEIIVPLADGPCGAWFLKHGRRKALTLAVVNTACALRPDQGGRIGQARIAMGTVAPVSLRAHQAEALLTGRKPSAELFAQAALLASGETSPRSSWRASADYRGTLIEVLVRRALHNAWREATGERGGEG